ncbi:hypothetical protein HJFPF1_12357 [Paramyrothecium foliicola]|nr:hypothetical protein HJFPF1_12357 [Paramyrothecium foliicola]
MADCTNQRKKIFASRARTGKQKGPAVTGPSARPQPILAVAKDAEVHMFDATKASQFAKDALDCTISVNTATTFNGQKARQSMLYSFVVPQLSQQPDGPAGFWSHTLLRECTLDSCVVDAVVGIGALSRARHDGLHPKPHHKLQRFGPQSCMHYYTALRHYTRAVAEFRRRVENISHTPLPPRTLLIFTITFSIFELLQGNTGAFDSLISNGLQLFSNPDHPPDRKEQQQQQQSWAITPALDDAEIYDAQCFLARTATWSAIFSPMYPRSRQVIASRAVLYKLGDLPPDRQTTSVADFWRTWWQFVTMAVIWHLRVQTLYASNCLEASILLELEEEQHLLLKRTELWADETQARLDEGAHDQFDKHILTMLVFEIKICYWSGYYALGPSETSWISCREDCIKILDMARETIVELTSTTGYESIISDGLMIGLLQLTRECRDLTVRTRALELLKLLMTPSSSWHVKSFVLGASACVAAEEMGRDGTTGHIPMLERYDWTEGSWNDDFTELHVSITSKGKDGFGFHRRKHLVLSPELLRVC